jgi:hypothetical protein
MHGDGKWTRDKSKGLCPLEGGRSSIYNPRSECEAICKS